jgi:hypothetical protein
MSDTTEHVYTSAAHEQYDAVETDSRTPTAWVGMILFAGVMLVLLGSFQVIEGIVAIVRSDYYLVTNGGLVFTFDYTAWGWIHLILGIIAVLTGIGMLMGQSWARYVGIAIAALSAFANMAFLPAYPVWSTIVIAVDVLIIYALAVHGRAMRV